MKVEDLYQEIILDHYRAKHHSGLRDPYSAEVSVMSMVRVLSSSSLRP